MKVFLISSDYSQIAWFLKCCNFFILLYNQHITLYSVSSVAQSCPTLCNSMDAACQASLSITSSWSLLRLMSIKLVMPSNHLIFCRPLQLLPSIFPSIRVFSNESVFHIMWPKFGVLAPASVFQWIFRTDFL